MASPDYPTPRSATITSSPAWDCPALPAHCRGIPTTTAAGINKGNDVLRELDASCGMASDIPTVYSCSNPCLIAMVIQMHVCTQVHKSAFTLCSALFHSEIYRIFLFVTVV